MPKVSVNLRSLLAACWLLLGASALLPAQGQFTDGADIRPKQNSPLSRFGLGDPLDQVHAAQSGLGGLQSVYQDPFHLNPLNPASLANLSATSFEVGLFGRSSSLSDASGSARTYQGNLRYLALGFPLRNPINLTLDQLENSWNGGMAFSITPTTLVGYDLRLAGAPNEDGISTANVLQGTGGTYRFSWSTAGRYRGLSAGLNLNYNFGKITNNRSVVFDSIPQALASEFREDFSLSGFSLGYGVQYAYHFKQDGAEGERVNSSRRLLFGLNGQLGSEVETNASFLDRRFSPNGGLFVSDTLRFAEDILGRATLPASLTFGVAYEDINRLFIGAEYGRSNYSSYRNDAQPEQLLDAARFAFGVQYIPNVNSYNSFWKRVRYRAGLRLEEDPREINGRRARRNAVTVGFGLPIRLPRQQISFLDIALEYGKFGVPGVLDATYYQLTTGFSLNDNSWFFKRKLN